jgi:LPXTG-motif cell wall-anchored protein
VGRYGLRRAAALALALAAAGALVATPAPAGGSGSPPGNNGTVKVDGTPFDTHPDNQPHVGCAFQVDLYGYDLGADLEADVLFEAVSPTAGANGPAGTTLLEDTLEIGEDAAGGGNDLDAEGTYDLTAALAGIDPHPQQGWHVRLTIDADGSQGARVKHKVFWVSGCGGGTTTTTTPHGSTTSTTAQHGTTTTTAPHGSTTTVSTPTTTPGTPTTAPGGPTTSATATPGGPTTTIHATTTTVDAGGTLPRTGSSATGTLVAAGLALVAVGALAIGAVRLRAGR